MKRASLDSMLLASTDPERLRTWYAAALEPEENIEMDPYRVLKFGGFYLMIDRRSDVSDRNPEPTRMILNFDVEDAREVAARFDAAGATWHAPLEDRDGSLFGTVIDPDGNYVQIIQLSEAARAQMQTP
jgi:uncharacterized glyoxalase superfamily protein PhnB